MQSPNIAKNNAAPALTAWLYASIVVVGIGILIFTVLNFTPVVNAQPDYTDDLGIDIPTLDYTAWRALPSQDHGRYKPFETACKEAMRQLVGREKLQKKDATSVVMMWMFETKPGSPPDASVWDDKKFLLCEYGDLRTLLFKMDDQGDISTRKLDEKEQKELEGRFASPKQLREFRTRLAMVRKTNLKKYEALTQDVDRQLNEALGRLGLYESIRGYAKLDYDGHAMSGAGYSAREKPTDPFAFVALDAVPGSPWFSMGDLRLIVRDQAAWHEVYMTERVKKAPQLNIAAKHQQALEEFKQQIKSNKAETALAELTRDLAKQRDEVLTDYEKLRTDKKDKEAFKLIEKTYNTLPTNMVNGESEVPADMRKTLQAIGNLTKAEEEQAADHQKEIKALFATLLDQRDARIVSDLRSQLPTARQHYDPEDPKFRMLHLTYMETRFPNIYKDAVMAQARPADKAERVLAAWKKVADAYREAYRTGEAGSFDSASQEFFTTVEAQSTPPYPGQDGIGDRVGAVLTGSSLNPPDRGLLALEQTFNRVAPFQWAWVLMLFSMLFFCLSLGLDSRVCYMVAWAAFAGSLGFQLFGFFVRVIISGRPPVTNMYETVVWVAFMSAIFGAILESIYRKKVIALAAAMVATLGLVLADQMPLALDPKINPLVPVLRSNFWLTIHVLTIVSSYAGGTLAWGLGNVALFLIVFGKGQSDAIKVLSKFTYRALQIAVLLLAAGTFLGGWWAAYSWGRFWGWDPKETGALIALVCYVIPLHMRYIGWIRDFGLAVSAIFCYAAILMSWYGVNFVFPAGLHAYGFGNGGAGWVYWACLINIEWVLVAALIYQNKQLRPAALKAELAGAGQSAEPMMISGPASEHVQAS